MLSDKLIKIVEELQIDLGGKTVLTEAASGAYVVTPVLAALAGAKVYAYTRATRYGTVDEIFAATQILIDECKQKLDITLIDSITPEIIAQADIITNSGHLRPLSEDMLQYAKDSLVIPLMFEAWEWRDADMDINYIRKRGFKVGATNERHPAVDVFGYLGDMAIKQLFDAGICPYRNKLVLICNNDFGPYIARVVARNCEGLAIIDKDEHKGKYAGIKGVDWIGGFPAINISEKYKDAEGIIFTAYPFVQSWIGSNSVIDADSIKHQFTDPLLLRYAGDMDTALLVQKGIRYFPEEVKPGHMGVLPSAIGNDPIIRLQAGSLKAAEALITGQHIYNNSPIVEIL
jgi:hypothetical protein